MFGWYLSLVASLTIRVVAWLAGVLTKVYAIELTAL
jgi:hypothetical protein